MFEVEQANKIFSNHCIISSGVIRRQPDIYYDGSIQKTGAVSVSIFW